MKKDNNKLHRKAMEQFEDAFSFDRYERERVADDIRFVTNESGQWDDKAALLRKNRPMYTIDKISPAVNQIVGEYTKSRVSIKVRASHGGEDDIANTYNGLIRNITSISKAQHAYDIAFKNITISGFGAWRISTDFSDDTAFDQDIKITPIVSPSTDVWIDPNSKDPNGRDATFMFVISEMSKDAFELKYPDAIASQFDNNILTLNNQSCQSGWANRDSVRVAEYWTKELVPGEIVLLSNQSVITDDKFKLIGDELKAKGITEVKRRKVKRRKVTFYRLSGSEVLEGPKVWAGKHIPIVLAYGYNNWVGNMHHYRGIVRKAKDAQRIFNYTASANIEAAALAPKDPWLVTPTMIAGHLNKWKNINTENSPFLIYNADPSAPNASPVREGAPSVQQALVLQMQQAEADIKATTGLFAPSLGDSPDAQSGRAILAQQRQGDTGSMELFDNLSKAIEYSGEILVDLIPLIYDATRQIRILNEDGSTKMVSINETIVDNQTGKEVLVNDLSKGKYDLTITSGPDFKTKRSEAVNVMNTLAKSNPNMAQVMTDLIAKNLDFDFSEELTERIRKTELGLPFITPNEKEQTIISQAQQAQAAKTQADDAINSKLLATQLTSADLLNEEMAAKIDGMEIDNENKRVKIEKLRADIAKVLADSNIAKLKVGAPVTHADVDAMATNTELLNANMEFSEIELSKEAVKVFPPGSEGLADIQELSQEDQGPATNNQPETGNETSDINHNNPNQDQTLATPKKILIPDPKSGLLVNVDTHEIYDPSTGKQLQ